MGLRERKAARTRQLLLDTGYRLFVEQGYEQTTMEQIASEAEVGASTLYRYFPTKDLLLLDQLTTWMDVADQLSERPDGEPLPEALAAAIRSSLEAIEDVERFAAVRAMVDDSPPARARLLDILIRSRADLEAVVAERLGRSPDELDVALISAVAFRVWELVGDRWWTNDHQGSPGAILDEVLRTLARTSVPYPALSAQ
ncbi:TetR/AcrR family transcriptional regulator [Tessaracoccus palaemonis]|uniref:TetR/AcrR family transcriptional regulator n=1 Tax=Tessaracoccus palaemonis TaxID=2829499 RepID=A0ABX8SJ14_9ACTN|nr:TetR/AcrR family transcriptional regulator [Tessaracoccus palaemonis]QXT62869.1 TetR/AcrR family transcriptional regulator [Tessaracoccus palaemonis]